MERWDEYDFEVLRNDCLIVGNWYGACLWQALHIKTLDYKGNKLRNRRVLLQEYDILRDLVETIFSQSSDDMAEVILELAGIALLNSTSWQYQKVCRNMADVFRKIWNQHADMILEILVRNAQMIKTVLEEELLIRYIDNVLLFIKSVYGYESKEYAQIYLHFLCECRYNGSEFKDEFLGRYEYFRRYLDGYDVYYVSCLFSCMIEILKQDEKEYKYWVKELENATERNKSSERYPDLKCKLEYIKALECEKRNDSKSVVKGLAQAISSYILPPTVQNSMFHVQVLIKASVHCHALGDYLTMVKYAEKGVSICEELGQKDTEAYYEIYIYIGLKMLYDQNYAKAQEIYGKNSRQIEEKFGKSCEYYIKYVNNLGLAYYGQGRIPEAIRCFEEASTVEGEEFEELKNELIFRNLYFIECMFGGDSAIMDKFIRKFLSISSLKASSNTGLKIQWLISKLDDVTVNFTEVDELFGDLYEMYKNHEVPENFKPVFELCIVMYQWRKDKKEAALISAGRVVKKLGSNIYTYYYAQTAITYLKLLINNGKYESARTFNERLIDYRYDEIVAKGLGDSSSELASLRMFMSYYLNLIDRHFYDSYSDKDFCVSLLERIIHCKTVEKDIRSAVGKYDSKQEDISFKLFEYCDFLRKINALDMRKDIIRKENSSQCEKEIEELDEQIFRYTTKLAELELWLNQKIDLTKVVKKFKLSKFTMPKEALAIEFFCYLDLDFEPWEMDDENTEIKYACFIVSPDMDHVAVRYAGSFGDKEYMLQEYYDSFFNGIDRGEAEDKEIICSFKNAILPIIEPYLCGNKKIYWGMDAEMHLIPAEWILGESHKNVVSIYADSAKYIRADERLEFENLSSLIMGRPEYAIQEGITDENPQLLCSAIECEEIARIVGGKALIGREAKQQAFNLNFDRDLIHISTHGKIDYVKDIFLEKNKLKQFYVLLSGYCDWCAGRTAEGYGNGVITADDVSYANMRNTKLAVIAACLSGFSSVNLLLGNCYCFRWALGIAGVHFSVTALWKTDDVATSIFMVLFYRYLKTEQIGTAFHMAKNKLRCITREEIERDIVLNRLFGQYENTTGYGSICPFEGDAYWAAFTCYCSWQEGFL